uniref:Uncharacterized protein n=1 Tax=Prevotella sp. GTC17262 TaxID=3236797 RepID=A0AB33JQR2_9BACT
MRIKFMILFLFFLGGIPFCIDIQSINCSSGDIKDKYGIVICNVTDSDMVYCTKENVKISFPIPLKMIEYEGGLKKLKKDMWHNIVDINNENHILGLVYILFDEYLHIIEIRAVNIAPMIDNWPIMTREYLQYLQKTEGRWRRISQKSKYYLYAFPYTFH